MNSLNLSEKELANVLGGRRSAAYTYGHYAGKAVIAGATIAGVAALFLNVQPDSTMSINSSTTNSN